jgi:radical SAM family uncharacterized protein
MIVNDKKLDAILAQVQKPARYTGGEHNSVIKDWNPTQVKVVLAFPDIYDLGMSNLGLSILYDILNRKPDVLAERVFSPWPDMETAMRQNGIPLYSLETRHTLDDFDLVGISLPYQQLYTNVLGLLDLAGFPIRSTQRDTQYPLVMAGGSATYNPEPMSDFFDLFVVGEGEEVLPEIVERYRQVQHQGREAQLRSLMQIDGVYVPRFYTPHYFVDGRLKATVPRDPDIPPIISKRILATLPPPITHPIVPYIDVVFNRAAVEIQRGCTRGCRFCQAGMIYRPVRQRSAKSVVDAVEEIVRNTGHREIGLLSLSSTDHTEISNIVQRLRASTGDPQLSVSLPSSRIESVTVDLVDQLSQGRRTGFTFAPEAATDRMRDVINKPIPTEEMLTVADAVFARGWRLIKLYFMIGQPEEQDEDVLAIADLARRVLETGEKHHSRKAQVRVGVSTFVPQPHTPFQWVGMASQEAIQHKQYLLKSTLGRAKGIILNWNDPQESLLEAALVRGDRRLGPVIARAWSLGCRFDGWHEHFKPHFWWQAFHEANLSPEWYANRSRERDEALPWDHINAGVTKSWLWREWQAALRGETTVDCRQSCTACGILRTFGDLRAQTAAGDWACPPLSQQHR